MSKKDRNPFIPSERVQQAAQQTSIAEKESKKAIAQQKARDKKAWRPSGRK